MKKAILAAILVLSVVACAPAPPSEVGIEPLPPERGVVPPIEGPGQAIEGYVPLGGGDLQAQIQDRMIIRTATIDMVVESTENSLARIEALAVQLGGYVSYSQSWKQDEQLYATVTIRIPAARFDDARKEIRDLAVEDPTENQNTSDVTQEFIDLDARITNLQRTEEELRELLAIVREKSEKAEDILAVYRELTAIREQIEQLQGQKNFLESQVELASVTVSLTPQVQVVDTGWDPGKTVREALRDLVQSLQGLADIAIRLFITAIPLTLLFLTPLVFVAWLVVRWWTGRRKPLPTA